MTALIPVVIANLPAIIALGQSGFNFVVSLRAAAQQTGEWTPAMETAFLNALIADGESRAWKTDAEIAAGK